MTDLVEIVRPPTELPPSRRFDVKRLLSAQTLIGLACLLLVGYFALVPIGYLLWSTFTDENGFTLRWFESAYNGDTSATDLGVMVWNSLLYAVGSTAVSMFLGTALAYLTVRTNVPFKRLAFAAALVPMIIPGILHTLAWIFLADPQVGLLNWILEPIFGRSILNIYSMWGMIAVEGFHMAPVVFLLMYAAFRSMDPSLEESALVCGAPLSTVLRKVTLPLMRPALYASVLIMFIRALESFEVPALLGLRRGIWVFTSRTWDALHGYPPNYGEAGAYSVTLLLITVGGIFWQSKLTSSAKRYQTVTGKGFRPVPMQLGKSRYVATGFVSLYFIVAVLMPLVMLVYASTQPFYSVPDADALSRVSLDNYRDVIAKPIVLNALKNSLILSIGTATAVMLIMAVVSWVVVRTKMPGRWLIDNLTFIPIAVPGLVLGVALLFVYIRNPLPIYGTMWILAIAYFTKYMPYGMRYVSTSMYQISAELEESAKTSGAGWWLTFRRVILPLLMPGILAGWIYIVLVSIRELSSSLLLYSPGNEVFAILIWSTWLNGELSQMAAMGVLMVLMLVVLVLIASRLGARVGVKEK